MLLLPARRPGLITQVAAILAPTATPPEDTSFVTGQTLGTLRNDFGAPVGFTVMVGAAPITVTALGRWVVAGNTQVHPIGLSNAGFVLLGAVNVDTNGAPAGAFLYGTLETPLVLSANTAYNIMSNENDGGDQWYDLNTTVTTTVVAAVTGATYYVDPSGHPDNGGPGQSFVPVSFKYH